MKIMMIFAVLLLAACQPAEDPLDMKVLTAFASFYADNGSLQINDGEPSLPDPLAAGWNGEPVCEKLHEDSDNRILRCTFPPAVGHERHYHSPHFGYTISGGRVRND